MATYARHVAHGRLMGGLVMGGMALLLMNGMVRGEEAASCARRIRGEGEESTLVILKPDAVAKPRPRRARRRANGVPRRALQTSRSADWLQ